MAVISYHEQHVKAGITALIFHIEIRDDFGFSGLRCYIVNAGGDSLISGIHNVSFTSETLNLKASIGRLKKTAPQCGVLLGGLLRFQGQ